MQPISLWSKSQIVGASIGALVCISIPIVFTVFLGIYGFKNPDKAAWIVRTSPTADEFSIFGTLAEAKANQNSEIVNIHGLFVSWFLWGFYLMLSPWAIAIITIITCFLHERVYQITFGVLNCLAGCAWLAWLIVGLVWRFNKYG